MTRQRIRQLENIIRVHSGLPILYSSRSQLAIQEKWKLHGQAGAQVGML